MKKKEELYSFPQQKDGAVAETDIRMVPIAELQDFEGHPFKVENDMALFELMQSIEKEGVIVPALARPKSGGGYELIAGHRRKAACKWAGIGVMPVVIRDLDDNQAVIAMVDSNLQREHLKPSEKAFAYKMKLEAMKRQGARTDLTSSQVGKKLSSSQVVAGTSDQAPPKLENPTMKVYPLQSGHDDVGNWIIQQDETTERAINSNEAWKEEAPGIRPRAKLIQKSKMMINLRMPLRLNLYKRKINDLQKAMTDGAFSISAYLVSQTITLKQIVGRALQMVIDYAVEQVDGANINDITYLESNLRTFCADNGLDAPEIAVNRGANLVW